tara:strand:- start:1550 stop:1966 length:417 start_codon:yes stop_codon:yes gene_type:complete
MKKYILVFATIILSSSSLLQAASDLSPTFSIRYEDFINEPTPTASVGLHLKIDEDRYTGFDVNTDGTDTRLLIGWKWGLFGIGSKSVTQGLVTTIHPHYTFGVSYEIVEGLASNFEYVMTPDNDDIEDKLRLTLSVSF